MGTVNVVLGEDTRLNLILGQQLENAVTEVVFDFSAWKTTYGTGTLALSVQRPGDDQPYAVTLTTSGTDATWSVTNLDTAYKGVGHIQLTYTVGTAIKKSVVYKFTVYESLGANGEYPSPGQTWQQNIEAEIGTLSNLPTTDKSSLVASINEIDGDITDVKQDLSDEKKYLKSLNYDTRISESDDMGVGHFVSGSTPSTNGNYAYYRHTPLFAVQDVSINIDTPIDSDLLLVVVLFDENGDFVGITRNNVRLESSPYSASASWMTVNGTYPAPYARLEFYRYPYADITNDITVTPVNDSTNVSIKLNNLESATIDGMSITLDKTAFTDGYLSITGETIASNEYKTSPFIAVNDQLEITITKIATAAWKTVFCYDSNQTLIKAFDYFPKITIILDSLTVLLPRGTAYVRYVTASGQLNVTTINYKMTNIPKHYLPSSLIEAWNSQTYGKMGSLFEKATDRALITIIDDDTPTSAYVTLFHDACEAQGIKGSYAVITSRWNLDDTLKDTLLGFESEGYGMCAHCYVQDSKWNNPLSNMSQCEADMINCIRDMQNAGFINFRHWLTPAGHVEPAMQDLAKRLGMLCAVSSGWNSIETTEAKYGRYALRRCSLEASDRTGSLTINDFKALIDEAVACNGWLLITTHMGNGEWDADAIANRFNVVVDYAQSRYMKFTTLQEAWSIRKAIYEFYEKF